MERRRGRPRTLAGTAAPPYSIHLQGWAHFTRLHGSRITIKTLVGTAAPPYSIHLQRCPNQFTLRSALNESSGYPAKVDCGQLRIVAPVCRRKLKLDSPNFRSKHRRTKISCSLRKGNSFASCVNDVCSKQPAFSVCRRHLKLDSPNFGSRHIVHEEWELLLT